MTLRKAREDKSQGVNEQVAYFVDTTPWGGYNSGASVSLIDANGEDISSTHLSGDVSVDGSVITTPQVIDLGKGIKYRLQIQWEIDGNLLETYCDIYGEE